MNKSKTLQAGIFVAVLIALHFAVNTVVQRMFIDQTLLEQADRQFKQQDLGDLELLFLGDSHVNHAFDPAQFDAGQAFNFASFGENYAQTYYKLVSVVDDAESNLQTVVLNVDLHSFAPIKADISDNNSYWKQYVDYQELGEITGRQMYYLGRRVVGNFLYFSYSNTALNALRLEPRAIRNGLIIDERDFSEETGVQLEESLERVVDNHFANSDELFDDGLVTYFEKIVELCIANNINLVLVQMPVTSAYSAAVDAVGIDRARFYADVQAMIPNNDLVRLVDMHDTFFGKDELFTNPNHLNLTGARQFTSAFEQQLSRWQLIEPE